MALAAGFVLAGGQSSRMGRDKALVPLAGQPLIEQALTILRHAGVDATILGNRPDLASFAPVLPDSPDQAATHEQAGRGPLEGICRALANASAELALVLSVDAPL